MAIDNKRPGRKAGFTIEAVRLMRKRLYETYDAMLQREISLSPTRARYLAIDYYIEQIVDMEIFPWSGQHIKTLLTYRKRYEHAGNK